MEFEFSFPMILLKFKEPAIWMERFGKKHSRAIKLLGNISTVIGIFGMLLAFAFMVRGAVAVINGGPAQVGLVIPGVRLPGSQFYVPLVEGIIVIFFMAVFHEGMHGIMAGAEGIRPKSVSPSSSYKLPNWICFEPEFSPRYNPSHLINIF